MSTTKQQILAQFKRSIPSWASASVRARYPYIIGRFIDHVGAKPTYTRAEAVQFLNHMMKTGARPYYIRWIGYVLITFYKYMGFQRPFSDRELPAKPMEHEMVKPTLSQDKVAALVAAVRAGGSSRMKAYLAISTVYGLRAIELAGLRGEDFKGNYITVRTAKGHALGVHPIPAEIAPYIAYSFKPCTTQSMSTLFKRMQKLANQSHVEKEGFHSIRRGLVKGLLDNKVDSRYVTMFLRWKVAGSMLTTYAAPDAAELPNAHAQIFKKHPYLSLWR